VGFVTWSDPATRCWRRASGTEGYIRATLASLEMLDQETHQGRPNAAWQARVARPHSKVGLLLAFRRLLRWALLSDPSYCMRWLDCMPWCKSGHPGSSVGCRRYGGRRGWLFAAYDHDEEATHAKLRHSSRMLSSRRFGTWRPHREEHRRWSLGRVSERRRSGPSCCAVFRPASRNLRSARRRTGVLPFRVGINIGDVIVEPTTSLETELKLPARLESIAHPAVSASRLLLTMKSR